MPLVLVIAVLSLFIAPWSVQMAEQYRTRLNTRDDVSRVDPGVFGESRSADRVFFVESLSGDRSSVQNVFVSTMQHGRSGVMFSKKGLIEVAPNGDRYIVLLDGRRYEGVPGEVEYRVMEFSRYAARIEAPAAGEEPPPTEKSLSTLALLQNPDAVNLGELLWRIGVPASALILALLAIPLSFVNPRAGRSINLVFALLTYMVYLNLLTVSQARVTQGKLAFALGWWPLHAAMLAILLLLFAHRLRLGGLRLRLQR
jgi:lipopolysaccharide export system permease protein